MQVTMRKEDAELIDQVRALGASGKSQEAIALALGFTSLGGLKYRLGQIGFEFMSTNDVRTVTGRKPYAAVEIVVDDLAQEPIPA